MFRTTTYLFVAIFLSLFMSQNAFAQSQTYKAGQKKLLEFGWDIPEYTYFADNVASMETSPFDGVVFHLKVPKGNDRRGFSVCNTDLLQESFFDFTKMAKIRSTKLTDNFILTFMQDDYDQIKFSWFDDAKWVNIKSNTRLLAKAVVATDAKGIFLDTERYFDPCPWTYNATLYPNQTFQQVYDKVRQRGKEYMIELQNTKPDIKVLYSFSYGFTPNWGKAGYEAQEYALMKPFLDGMLEAAGPQVTLIDGNEATYWSAKNDVFTWWTKQIKEEYPKDRIPSELVAKYKKQYQAASASVSNTFYNVPYGQDPFNFDYGFTPDFQAKWVRNTMYNHLLTSDEYVWAYSQGDVDWWKKPTFKNKQELVDGINEAKTKLAAGQSIGTTMKPATNKIEAIFEDIAPFVGTLSGPTNNGNIPVGDVKFTLFANDASKLNFHYLYINGYSETYLIDPVKTVNLPAGKYTAWVFGYTKDNKTYQTNPITFTVGAVQVSDTQAPTVPSTISASNITTNSFTATWAASTDNVAVTAYDVFKDGVFAQNTTNTNFSFTGLNENTTYSITVKARDAAGNVSAASLPLSVKTLVGQVSDTQVPTVPSTISASNITTNSFTATWNASTDNVAVTGYDVFKDGVFAQNTTNTNFSFTALNPNTTYSITVKARDAAGNISAASLPLSVKTLTANTGGGDTQAPTPPIYVQSFGISETGFWLQWSGATDNIAVTGYEVFVNGISAAKTGQYVTYLTLNNLLKATNYSVTIKAFDAAGNISIASNALVVKTLGTADTQAPSIPLNLKASNITANSFTLSWAASTDNVGVAKYSIYRNGFVIATVLGNVTSFDAQNLVPNNTYSMSVNASDAANNTSKTSAILVVKTLTFTAVTNNLITFSEQGTGTKGLSPAVFSNVDAKNTSATFSGFSSTDGVISKPTFEDKTIGTQNRMATITSTNATMIFTAPVYVSSLWTTSILTNKATGWTLIGSLKGVDKFTFTPNSTNFAIKNWLEVKTGAGIAVDKLTWLNASGVMIDDIKIDAAVVVAAKISNAATVAPNPIQDYANITFFNNAPVTTIVRLADFNGKIYFTKQVETNPGENYFQLDATDLPNGFYLLNINRQDRNETVKILVQR